MGLQSSSLFCCTLMTFSLPHSMAKQHVIQLPWQQGYIPPLATVALIFWISFWKRKYLQKLVANFFIKFTLNWIIFRSFYTDPHCHVPVHKRSLVLRCDAFECFSSFKLYIRFYILCILRFKAIQEVLQTSFFPLCGTYYHRWKKQIQHYMW